MHLLLGSFPIKQIFSEAGFLFYMRIVHSNIALPDVVGGEHTPSVRVRSQGPQVSGRGIEGMELSLPAIIRRIRPKFKDGKHNDFSYFRYVCGHFVLCEQLDKSRGLRDVDQWQR